MIVLPICQFPTQVIAVDDNEDFLKSLKISFKNKLLGQYFSSPHQALNYLNQTNNIQPFISSIVEFKESSPNVIETKADIENIHTHIYNPDRFNEISTVIVDYTMPSMTGLELCSKLKNENVHVILLTGEAGHNIAVDAFNRGLINQFILKNEENLLNTIVDRIKQEQKKYFIFLTRFILAGKGHDESADEIKKLLSDPKLALLFEETMKKLNIVEYYLLNAEGDFLLIDKKNKFHIFACRTDYMMKSFIEMADMSQPTKKTKAILTSLENRKKIPCFLDDDEFSLPVEQWDAYLHACNTLEGDHDTYYYAIIDANKNPKFDHSDVSFYKV